MVLQVKIDGILAVETKCDTPVSSHRYRVGAFSISSQPVKLEAGNIHVLWFYSSVQPVKQALDANLAFGDDAPVISLPEKPFKPSMFKSPNHGIYAIIWNALLIEGITQVKLVRSKC